MRGVHLKRSLNYNERARVVATLRLIHEAILYSERYNRGVQVYNLKLNKENFYLK